MAYSACCICGNIKENTDTLDKIIHFCDKNCQLIHIYNTVITDPENRKLHQISMEYIKAAPSPELKTKAVQEYVDVINEGMTRSMDELVKNQANKPVKRNRKTLTVRPTTNTSNPFTEALWDHPSRTPRKDHSNGRQR